jgi:adenylate kinase family enzyme
VYEKDTEPLIEYYDNKKVTVKINAVGEVDNIYSELSKEF